MRPRSSSPSAPRHRAGRALALAAVLGGMLLFALAPRTAAAGQMSGMRPQAGTGSSMVPHAPVEVPVSPGLKKVLEGLLCQCGCNLDAYQCQQTMTCNVSTSMWDQAARLVDQQGRTPEQALAAFAADYGEYVLAAPTKRGFNLVAWALPFVALGIGAVVIGVVLRRWRPRVVASASPATAELESRYLEQVERELWEDG